MVSATCFFTKREDKVFLVTNWHVVSGKNADTLQNLDEKNGGIPNKLRIYVPLSEDNGVVTYGDEIYIDIDLYAEDNPVWLDRKKGDRFIDVAVIPVSVPEKYAITMIEDGEEFFNEHTGIEITSPLYIIGYPFGKICGELPIWKRSTVASEPNYQMDDDMPYFFVDTASRQGMSGSPVVLFEKRSALLMEDDKVGVHYTKFIGIYSGRIGSEKEGDAQLGRVWKACIIDELISSNETD